MDVEIIIEGKKIPTVVVVSKTDGEDSLLENNFPGFNDALMKASHDRAGKPPSIQAVIN